MPALPARKAGRIIGAAISAIARAPRVCAERARASDASVLAELLRDNSFRRHTTLDPIADDGIPVDDIASRAATAMEHARHHEESRVLGR